MRCSSALGDAAQARAEAQILGDRELAVERGVLAEEADARPRTAAPALRERVDTEAATRCRASAG